MFDVVSNYKQNRPRLLAFYIAIAHETTYLCRFSNYGHQLFVISIRTKNNNTIVHSNMKMQQYRCMGDNQFMLFLYHDSLRLKTSIYYQTTSPYIEVKKLFMNYKMTCCFPVIIYIL